MVKYIFLREILSNILEIIEELLRNYEMTFSDFNFIYLYR